MRNLTIEEMNLVSGAGSTDGGGGGGGSSSGDVNVLNGNCILNHFLDGNTVKVQVLDDLLDLASTSAFS